MTKRIFLPNVLRTAAAACAFVVLSACGQTPTADAQGQAMATLPASAPTDCPAVATFAGGCFWSAEETFEEVRGVCMAVSGYSGGTKASPKYEQVSGGSTGHAEAVQVYYDPKVVTFEQLCDVFFLGMHDPTQLNRQGNDVGTEYRSVAFYRTPAEKEIIAKTIARVNASKHYSSPVVTVLEGFSKFYPAETYHQGYFRTHPDNPYISGYSMSKVMKFRKAFPQLLKPSSTFNSNVSGV